VLTFAKYSLDLTDYDKKKFVTQHDNSRTNILSSLELRSEGHSFANHLSA
jgi:hypothetical protein